MSSSSISSNNTSLNQRLDTVFKKSHELTILCNIELCVIHYGLNGELKTWPEDRDKVRDIALRYLQLDLATRRKKSYDLYGFLDKTKKTKYLVTKKKKPKMTHVVDPISPPDQISQLIQSIELTTIELQERLSFLESQKQNSNSTLSPPFSLNHHDHIQYLNPNPNQGDANLSPLSSLTHQDHIQYLNPNHGDASLSPLSSLTHQDHIHYLNPDPNYGDASLSPPFSLNHHDQIQYLNPNPNQGDASLSTLNHIQSLNPNPSQFSLLIYNHKDDTLSQIPFSHLNNVQLPYISNTDDIQRQSYVYDQLKSNNFQNPCVSNSPTVEDFELIQRETSGCVQTNNNIIDPCLLDDFWSDLSTTINDVNF